MSMKSQQANMQRLHELLSQELSVMWGDYDSSTNGAKKTFLHLGKVFLRALAKDLGLRDVRVTSNPGGIAVSGECCLYGMWEDSGIFVSIQQPVCGDGVLLYRTIRHIKDHRGGYNNYIHLTELASLPYEIVLERLRGLCRDNLDTWAA